MANNPPISLIRKQRVYACAEAFNSSEAAHEHALLTHQTGHLLVTLGNMFIEMPTFNGHIPTETSELLISIGRKLKAHK